MCLKRFGMRKSRVVLCLMVGAIFLRAHQSKAAADKLFGNMAYFTDCPYIAEKVTLVKGDRVVWNGRLHVSLLEFKLLAQHLVSWFPQEKGVARDAQLYETHPRRTRGDQPRAGGREPPANDCPAARTRPQHDRTGIAPRGAHPEHLPGHARPARRETRGPAAAEAPDAPVPPGLRAGRLGAALVAGADCHAAADGVS